MKDATLVVTWLPADIAGTSREFVTPHINGLLTLDDDDGAPVVVTSNDPGADPLGPSDIPGVLFVFTELDDDDRQELGDAELALVAAARAAGFHIKVVDGKEDQMDPTKLRPLRSRVDSHIDLVKVGDLVYLLDEVGDGDGLVIAPGTPAVVTKDSSFVHGGVVVQIVPLDFEIWIPHQTFGAAR